MDLLHSKTFITNNKQDSSHYFAMFQVEKPPNPDEIPSCGRLRALRKQKRDVKQPIERVRWITLRRCRREQLFQCCNRFAELHGILQGLHSHSHLFHMREKMVKMVYQQNI